jgi:hypothetical protein
VPSKGRVLEGVITQADLMQGSHYHTFWASEAMNGLVGALGGKPNACSASFLRPEKRGRSPQKHLQK